MRSDGKIVVMGNRSVNNTGGDKNSVTHAVLSATGAVESTGLPTFTVPVVGVDMALLPNGAAVVAGYTEGALTRKDMMLAKFLP